MVLRESSAITMNVGRFAGFREPGCGNPLALLRCVDLHAGLQGIEAEIHLERVVVHRQAHLGAPLAAVHVDNHPLEALERTRDDADALVLVEVCHGFLHDLPEGKEVRKQVLVSFFQGRDLLIRREEPDKTGSALQAGVERRGDGIRLQEHIAGKNRGKRLVPGTQPPDAQAAPRPEEPRVYPTQFLLGKCEKTGFASCPDLKGVVGHFSLSVRRRYHRARCSSSPGMTAGAWTELRGMPIIYCKECACSGDCFPSSVWPLSAPCRLPRRPFCSSCRRVSTENPSPRRWLPRKD